MLFRIVLPALAAIGFAMGLIFTFEYGAPKAAIANQLTAPPATPYEKTVSGTGLVEANTRNIAVGSHLSGIISKIIVKEGQAVKEGFPLFQLDDEAAQAEVALQQQAVVVAVAQITSAEAALADDVDQLQRAEGLKAGASISIDTLQRRRFAVKKSQAALALAKAQKIQAEAALNAAEVQFRRHTVLAPVTGRILRINIRAGEYLHAGEGSPPILMGNDRPLHLRVQIDENDLWRYGADAPAQASLRSNKDINFKLSFVRLEPYVLPKRDLSGDTSERIDTRVLEVVYAFDPGNQPVFIGQQMDVFIEAKAASD